MSAHSSIILLDLVELLTEGSINDGLTTCGQLPVPVLSTWEQLAVYWIITRPAKDRGPSFVGAPVLTSELGFHRWHGSTAICLSFRQYMVSIVGDFSALSFVCS